MKILLVESKIRIARRIQESLEKEGHTVLLASDGQLGRKLMLSTNVDCVIINSELPKLNGIDLCRNIRSLKPEAIILMIFPSENAAAMSGGFDSGADDCLLQPLDTAELLARLNALMKRKIGNEAEIPKVIVYAGVELNLDNRTVKREGIEINLTPKEFLLLEYLMRNQGRVLLREEIAQNVWSTKLQPGMNFVDVYINYLRKKIDKPFSVKLIHTKHWVGYIFQVPEYSI